MFRGSHRGLVGAGVDLTVFVACARVFGSWLFACHVAAFRPWLLKSAAHAVEIVCAAAVVRQRACIGAVDFSREHYHCGASGAVDTLQSFNQYFCAGAIGQI